MGKSTHWLTTAFTTTPNSTTISQDVIVDGSKLLDDEDVDECTVLRIIGDYTRDVDASALVASGVTFHGIAPQADTLAVTEGSSPGLISTTEQDAQAFWMWKYGFATWTTPALDYHYEREIDITTRRVLRSNEDIVLRTDQSVATGAAGIFEGWSFRVLVLY